MCKQALWLAPAPPACTPIHHNHNAINYYKQKASSHDGYRLLHYTRKLQRQQKRQKEMNACTLLE